MASSTASVGTTPDLVIYHRDCFDGVAAAWAVTKAFPDVQCIGLSHSNPLERCPLAEFRGKRVVVLDYCFKQDVMNQIAEVVKSINVYDHHASAMGVTVSPNKGDILLDMTRSGAQIAWDVFHRGKPRPPVIDYIADRDLWTWKLPQSKECCAYIYSGNVTIQTIEKLYQEWNLESFASTGRIILDVRNRDIKAMAKGFNLASFFVPRDGGRTGHTGPRVPSDRSDEYIVMVGDCNWMFRSEVGNYLMEKSSDGVNCDFVVLYTYYHDTKTFSISLRGKDCRVDLSALAQRFGGGGHPNASGFSSPHMDFVKVHPRDPDAVSVPATAPSATHLKEN